MTQDVEGSIRFTGIVSDCAVTANNCVRSTNGAGARFRLRRRGWSSRLRLPASAYGVNWIAICALLMTQRLPMRRTPRLIGS